MPFDGNTYDTKRDYRRLSTQLISVREFLEDHRGSFFTLAELEHELDYPQASISARLRDLRKTKFGSYVIARRYRSAGTCEYAMELPF